MSRKRAYISSAGMYVPEKVVTNHDLELRVETSDEWIRERTGIRERRIVGDGECTSDLAVRAARDCLARTKWGPEDIDLIIIPTVTPDMMFPSTACVVQEKLGAKNAWGFDLSAACSGFLFALVTGAQFVETGKCERVLVIGADVMSSIADPEDRATCVLFGDGAGAVLLEATEEEDRGILDHILRCDGSGGEFLYMPAGGSKRPASRETVENRLHYIRQDGRTVFKFAVKYMADVSVEILERNGLPTSAVRWFIPHQANLRIIRSTADRLQLDDRQLVINIDRYANTTAATIPMCLAEIFQNGSLQRGDLILMASFGAGFTWGSVLARW